MPVQTFCIVGRAGAGKTKFIEQLIPELVRLGLRVASFKLSGRPFQFDYPLSDAHRAAKAGAVRSVLGHRDGVVIFGGAPVEDSELLEMAGSGCDLVLVEGRVLEGSPVIEVVRAGLPYFSSDQVWLTVTERPLDRTLEVGGPAQAAEKVAEYLKFSLPRV